MIRDAFTEKEQIRIDAALEAWRPLLPPGLTLDLTGETDFAQTCKGCVTISRESTKPSELAECSSYYDFGGPTNYSYIRIDKRAGSGDNFQRVVAHEIGHSLGLDHRRKSIMSAHPNGAPSEKDAAILRGIYAPPLSAATTVPAHAAPLLDAGGTQKQE